MQCHLGRVSEWSTRNRLNINFKKTKEMIVGVSTSLPPPAISINGNVIDRVAEFKLLGVTLDPALRWHALVNSTCNKAATRLYFLKHLRRNHISESDLYTFYTAMIRPVVEYACPEWYSSLTNKQ